MLEHCSQLVQTQGGRQGETSGHGFHIARGRICRRRAFHVLYGRMDLRKTEFDPSASAPQKNFVSLIAMARPERS